MKFKGGRKSAGLALAVAIAGLLAGLAVNAGSALIVDTPRRSDVILVLAGETEHRPEHATQLLGQEYARKMVLDVPAESKIYEFIQIELAQRYVQSLPQAASISICPIEGLSTQAESRDAAQCLAREGPKSVLIVTSDFHTRRALLIFQKELPAFSFSVAAVRDDTQFGSRWWTRRQWAKTCLDEWLRLLWWTAVDKWR
jgi:uncharacterized SAM-binding protein YcdF (DUF218 family)